MLCPSHHLLDLDVNRKLCATAPSDQLHSPAHSNKGLLYQFLYCPEKNLIASESPETEQCAKSTSAITDWSHFVYFAVLFSMLVCRLLHTREPLPFLI